MQTEYDDLYLRAEARLLTARTSLSEAVKALLDAQAKVNNEFIRYAAGGYNSEHMINRAVSDVRYAREDKAVAEQEHDKACAQYNAAYAARLKARGGRAPGGVLVVKTNYR